MMFCPRCKSILLPEKTDKKTRLACSCGYVSNTKKAIIKEQVKLKKGVEVKQRKVILPKTKATCPKCNNKQAYYWMQQTRGSDEAETRFFECVKCSYRWREY